MAVVIIIGVLFGFFIFLSIFSFKKEKDDLGVYSAVMALFAGVFLYFTIFIFPPSKDYIESTINYYNSIKKRVETLKELDPECKEVVISTFSPGLKSEVDSINKIIRQNKSRIGTWNERFVSKEIANLEEISYEGL